MALTGILPLSSFGVGTGVANTAPAASQSSGLSTTGNGFFTGLGDVLGGALSTGANFLSGLATIDLFKRAQGAGIQNTATGSATGDGQQTGAIPAGSPQGSGLPDWLVPAGVGVIALLLVVLMLRG